MKRVLNKWNSLLLAILLPWMLQSCGGGTGNSNNVDSLQEVNENNAAVDNESSDFAVKAANGGMMEVQLGELAQKNASSARVKAFGQMMVNDHSKANNDLKTLAASKNIILPDSVSGPQKDHIDELQQKTGTDFDKAYMDMMVDDHKEDVDMFEKASNNLKDADLKSFAATTLPTLRNHLDSAQVIQEDNRKMMGNSKRGSQK